MVKMIRAPQNQRSNSIRKYHECKFWICNSCLWCASYLSGEDNSSEKCPTCDSDRMDLIPICETETYRLEMDGSGICMEFWNLQK